MKKIIIAGLLISASTFATAMATAEEHQETEKQEYTADGIPIFHIPATGNATNLIEDDTIIIQLPTGEELIGAATNESIEDEIEIIHLPMEK